MHQSAPSFYKKGYGPFFVMAAVCAAASACGSNSPTSATAAAGLGGVTLSSTSVVGVATVTGTITLTAAAPAGGATVTLTSSNAVASVPASVVVDQGATSQTFTVTVVNSPSTSITITATYAGTSQAVGLTIGRLTLLNISLSATSVAAGSVVVGTVTLTGPAPAGGALVSLASSNASATAPSSVAIPEGSTSQTFGIATLGSLPATTASTITASYGGSTWTATLTIAAKLALQTVSLALGTVPGGLPVVGTVTLDAVAPPGGATVSLTSSSPVATVPGSVIVAEGTISQTFTVTTIDAPPSTTAAITATFAATSLTAGLAVLAYPNVSGVTCSSTTLTGGTSVSCSGTLASPAPAAGWQLALTSDNAAASVPGSIAVPPGSSTFAFTISTTAVTAATSANIQIVDAPSGFILYTRVLSVTP
jgi:hypothetical protein